MGKVRARLEEAVRGPAPLGPLISNPSLRIPYYNHILTLFTASQTRSLLPTATSRATAILAASTTPTLRPPRASKSTRAVRQPRPRAPNRPREVPAGAATKHLHRRHHFTNRRITAPSLQPRRPAPPTHSTDITEPVAFPSSDVGRPPLARRVALPARRPVLGRRHVRSAAARSTARQVPLQGVRVGRAREEGRH